MDSISINMSSTKSAVSEVENIIDNEVIEEAKKSAKMIIDSIEKSSGEFIDSLKEEVKREETLIEEVGNLLISVAKYVQSAAETFADVDQLYNITKLP